MELQKVIDNLGISPDQIVKVVNFGNIETLENGYFAKSQDIKTYDMLQVITISKNIHWTDGTCRPAYGSLSHEISVYLNTRIELKNSMVLPQ